MAVVFSKRHTVYKVGVALLLVGVVVFTVGFATPNWSYTVIKDELNKMENSLGLWVMCSPTSMYHVYTGDKICVTIFSYNSRPEWLTAVQILQSMSLASSLIALLYVFVCNFVSKRGKFNRAVECLAFASVILGVVGLAVYGAEQAKTLQNLQEINEKNPYFQITHEHISWSFIVDLVGLFIVFVAAVIVSVYNKPIPADDITISFHAVPQTVAVASNGGYITAGYTIQTHNEGHPYIGTSSANVAPPAYSDVCPAAYATAGYSMAPPTYASLQSPAPNGSGQQAIFVPLQASPYAVRAVGGVHTPVVSDHDVPNYGKK